MKLSYLGHSCFTIEHEGTLVLIDPFLTGNPKASVKPEDLNPDAILLTHGHGDHLGDTVAIAERTGATVVAIVELANEIAGDLPDGHPVLDPNLGGTVELPWGWVRLVPALHTGLSPKGTPHSPAGLVISIGDKVIYHLGDTALFSDLSLPGRRIHLDLAIIPIGGHYTMDHYDAVEAARLVGARTVIPCHYNTFPPIAADGELFAENVRLHGITALVLEPGQDTKL